MRSLSFLLATIAFLCFTSTQAARLNYNVPFENVTLNPNNYIQGTYTFGQHSIIFCYENNLQSVGVVKWPYRGRQYTSTLNASLITNTNFQGQLADASGTITVTNNQTTPLVVSCMYAF